MPDNIKLARNLQLDLKLTKARIRYSIIVDEILLVFLAAE